jgi:hypothetical protein
LKCVEINNDVLVSICSLIFERWRRRPSPGRPWPQSRLGPGRPDQRPVCICGPYGVRASEDSRPVRRPAAAARERPTGHPQIVGPCAGPMDRSVRAPLYPGPCTLHQPERVLCTGSMRWPRCIAAWHQAAKVGAAKLEADPWPASPAQSLGGSRYLPARQIARRLEVNYETDSPLTY